MNTVQPVTTDVETHVDATPAPVRCKSTYYGGLCPGEDIQTDGRCPQHTSLLPEQIVTSDGAL